MNTIPRNLQGEFKTGEFGCGHRQERYVATGEFRRPRKGEFYLSGAIVEAYRAPNDLMAERWIAVRKT